MSQGPHVHRSREQGELGWELSPLEPVGGEGELGVRTEPPPADGGTRVTYVCIQTPKNVCIQTPKNNYIPGCP